MAKPNEILLEYRQAGRKTWAIRFYQDGLVKEYSDSEMVFEDEKIVTHSLPLAWRELARLTDVELGKLLAALRKVDFFSLPDQVGDPNQVSDGIRYTWTVHLDGKQKTVLAFGSQASSQPALKALGEMIQEVTADAFDRETDDEGKDSQDQPDAL
jgi:hypothetical protein